MLCHSKYTEKAVIYTTPSVVPWSWKCDKYCKNQLQITQTQYNLSLCFHTDSCFCLLLSLNASIKNQLLGFLINIGLNSWIFFSAGKFSEICGDLNAQLPLPWKDVVQLHSHSVLLKKYPQMCSPSSCSLPELMIYLWHSQKAGRQVKFSKMGREVNNVL